MNLDPESAAAVVTATLAAHELDSAGASHAGDADAHAAVCANCGAAVSGRYCQNCGQSTHLHRSLLHLIEEVLHGIWHFDTKAWRTLPYLIFKPGVLTRRFIDGQRTRYVSPLALFLFMVFFMFFVFSLGGNSGEINLHGETASVRAGYEKELARNKIEIAEARQKLATADKATADIEALQEELNSALAEQKVLLGLIALNGKTEEKTAGKNAVGTEGANVLLDANLNEQDVNTGSKKFDGLIRHALKNPDLTLYKMKSAAYKFAFILVPLSLPFLWLMFLRRKDITMYDHAVFSLYSLSFMALLLAALGLFAHFGWEGIAVMGAVFVPPLHMYLQLRDTYQLGRAATLWRTLALLIVAGLIILCYLLIVTAMSLH